MNALDPRLPAGPLAERWTRRSAELRLIAPTRRRHFHVIVVGSGLAGASAWSARRSGGPLRFTCSAQRRSDSAISRSSGQDGRSMAAL